MFDVWYSSCFYWSKSPRFDTRHGTHFIFWFVNFPIIFSLHFIYVEADWLIYNLILIHNGVLFEWYTEILHFLFNSCELFNFPSNSNKYLIETKTFVYSIRYIKRSPWPDGMLYLHMRCVHPTLQNKSNIKIGFILCISNTVVL